MTTDQKLTPESVADFLKQKKDSQVTGLRQTLLTTSDANPDQYAQAVAISKKRGVPAAAVEADFDSYMKQEKFSPEMVASVVSNYPRFRDWLSKPENAKLAHDDVGALTSAIDFGRSLGGGIVGEAVGLTMRGTGALLEANTVIQDYLSEAVPGYRYLPGAMFSREGSRLLAQPLQTGGEAIQDFSDRYVNAPQERRGLHTDIGSGLGQVAGQIATFLLTGGVGNIAMTAAQGAGQQDQRIDEAGGATPGEKTAAVLLGATATAASEKVELGILLKGVPGLDKFLAKLPEKIANKWLRKTVDIGAVGGAEIFQESIEGLLHDSVEHYTYNPDKEIGESILAEAKAAGATGSIARGIVMALTPGRSGATRRTGQESQQVAQQVAEAAKASKLRARSPEKFREALGSADQSVYINPEGAMTFYQSLAPEDQARLNAAMPDLRQKIEAAADTGTDLVIDQRDYMAYIAGAEQSKQLEEYVKFSSRDLSAWDEKQLQEINDSLPDDGDDDISTQALEPMEQLDRRFQQMLLAAEESGNPHNARLQSQIFNARAFLSMAKGNPEMEARALQMFGSLTIQRQGKLAPQKDNFDTFVNDARKYIEARDKRNAAPQQKDMLGGVKQKKKGKARPTPIITWLGSIGGIDPDNPIAGELRALDVTPKSHKRLFARGSKLGFDTIPVEEFRQAFADQNIEPQDDGNGYVDTDWLLEQIRNETFGKGALTPEQKAQEDRLRQIDELESLLAENGLDILEASNADIRKVAYGAQGEGGQTFFQSGPTAPPFHSAVLKAVEALPQAKGTAEQFLAQIRKTPGVREEEIEWIGLDEFLKGKKSVTRDEIAEYIRENQVQIEEVTLGGETYRFGSTQEYVDEIQRLERQRRFDEAEALTLEMEHRELGNPNTGTKFAQYTLPGGENYREVLLTLPPTENVLEQWQVVTKSGVGRGIYASEEAAKAAAEKVEGGEVIRLETLRLEGGFKSSHFDQPNILAHVRLNDRTDADGKRVLFVEEIQSDWHQQGRKKGYQNAATLAEVERKAREAFGPDLERAKQSAEIYRSKDADLSKKADEAKQKFFASLPPRSDEALANLKAMSISDIEGIVPESPELKAWRAAYDQWKNNSHYLKSYTQDVERFEGLIADAKNEPAYRNAVPDAPLKKTWHEMAFRRIVRMAAEQGYDRVAWTPGEVQNARYDLSKQVRAIEVNRYNDGFEVAAYKDDGELDNGTPSIHEKGVAADRVADLIGKDLADRAFAELNDGKTETFFEGDGLKIGGEGMKGFYDKILPSYAKKFAKKFGTDVGMTAIRVIPKEIAPFAVVLPNGKVVHTTDSRKNAEAVAANFPGAVIEEPKIEATKVHSLDITPAMRETALSEGFALFQPNRGSFMTFPDGRNVITMFQGSDLSTVLHEAGHFYAYMLRAMAKEFPDSEYAKQWATVSRWWQGNAKSILKEARGSQSYKIEKEPASGRFIVRGPYGKQFGVFKTRREAQSERDALQTNLTVELTALKEEDLLRVITEGAKTEAEGVLHIVMEEQFARGFEAHLMTGKAPSLEMKNAFRIFGEWLTRIYKDVRNLNVNLTPEIRGVFDRLLATEEQIEAMRQLEIVKVDPTVAGLLNKQEREAYQRQEQKIVDGAKEKLTRDVMKDERRKQTAEYKAERAKLLEENLKGLRESRVYRAQAAMQREGADPAIIADLHGFTSADEMQKTLADLEPLEKQAERITEAEMDSRYGNWLKDGSIERAAIERINEAEAGFDKSQREYDLASKKAGTPATSKAALKAAAKRYHDGMTVRDATQSTRFMRAAVKAARMYGAAAKVGKWQEAAKWKRQQILNQHLYKLSREADKLIEKKFKNWKQLRHTDKKIAGSLDIDYAKAARAVLAKYGADRFAFDIDGWLAKLKVTDPFAEEILSGVIRENAIAAKPWKSLTMQEFKELGGVIDSIVHLAKDHKEHEIEGKRLTAKEAAEEASASILAHNKDKTSTKRYETMLDTVGEFVSGIDKEIVSVEFIVKALDGGNVNGTVAQLLINPLRESNAEDVKMQREKARALRDILKKNKNIKNWNRKVFDAETGQSFNIKNIVSMALNMGNPSNFGKLLEGERKPPKEGFDPVPWDRSDAERLVFSHLTKDDMDMVQEIWDFFETLRPDLQRATRELTGIHMDVIDPEPLQTPWGEYRGGYMPLVYDKKRSYEGGRNAESANPFEDHFAIPSVNRGMTKSRTNFNAPLLLDFDSILVQHVNKSVHLITHGNTIRKLDRLVQRSEFRSAVIRVGGVEAYNQFRPWLQAVAKNSVYDAPVSKVDAAFRHLRVASTNLFLGLGTGTMVKQALGITATYAAVTRGELSHKNFFKAFARYATSPLGSWQFAMAHSKILPGRAAMPNADVGAVTAAAKRKANAFNTAQAVGGYALGYAQLASVDMPTWYAGYFEGLDRYEGNKKQAVSYADAIVRQTQGSGSVMDLSKIQRGSEAQKTMATMFGTYTLGVLYPKLREVGIDASKNPRAAFRAAITLIPLVIMPGLIEAYMSGDEPEDDETWYAWAALRSLLYGTSAIPVGGQIMEGLLGDYNFSMSPVESPINMMINGLKAVGDEGKEDSLIRGAVVGIAMTTKLPVYQPYKMIDEMRQINSGEDELSVRELFLGAPDDERR